MKKQLLSFLLASTPGLAAFAQPTVQYAMNFSAGTTVVRQNCDVADPGPGGANQTWDFSSLTDESDTLVSWFAAPPANAPFTGASLVERTNDSMIKYYKKTPSETQLIGMVDSTAGLNGAEIAYTNAQLQLMRPLTYNLTKNDTFELEANFSGFNFTGKGTIEFSVDGYGTIKLPGKSYTNVLRVKIVEDEVDTIPPPISASIHRTTIRYMWFDDLHRAPLFIIDSTDYDGSSEQSASYLKTETYPLSIHEKTISAIGLSATFRDNALVVKSNFDKSKDYEVILFNINGQQVFHKQFIASQSLQVFDISSDLAAGMYLVYVNEKNNGAPASVTKVLKN